jgi:hypothetical protein
MPIYQWDGDSWRNINSVWQWDGDSWRQINSGWQWDGDSWRQFFSSGTFDPEIRNTAGDLISNSTVGTTLVGYRGSNVSGTYTFVWQYRLGTNAANTWFNQGGTGATGTLTGGTLTTNYVTDGSDLVAIETPSYSYTLNTRFRVTKSSETQNSNTVRIRKRTPVRLVNTASGARGYNSFSTTYNALIDEPYPTDRIDFWSSTSWQSTTTLTNDTRPDYYIFTIATGTSTYTRDSRTLDSANPRTPTNAARYTVQNGDVGETIRVTIRAYNSSTGSPVTETTTTPIVDDGTLKAVTNLVLSESDSNPGKLDLRWTPSRGGNENTITYTWQIYRDDVFIISGSTTSLGNPVVIFYPTASGVYVTTTGVYKFRVVASQVGQSSATSGFSNTVNVTAPGTFTISLTNRTSDLGQPVAFTIDPFEESTTILNRYNTSWSSAGTRVTEYVSRWTRPDGTFSDYINGLTRTDSWGIFQSGTHSLRVTATNDRYQYIRIDWTAATNAGSYRLVYRLYNNPRFVGTAGSNITVNFDSSTTFFDVALLDNDLYWAVEVVSITAYRFADQIGPARLVAGSTTSNTQVVATRVVTRSQSLTFITVSAGTVTITGTPQVFDSFGYSLSGWTPTASNAEWTFERDWGRTNAGALTSTYDRGSFSTEFIDGADIGENMQFRIRGTFRGTTTSYVTDTSPTILPYPPTYTLTNLFDGRFTIEDLTSNGATNYFGTYTGGTVPNTLLSTSFTTPALSEGTKTVSLFARLRKTINGVSQLFDSATSRTQTINVQEIAAFNWTPSDTTVTPSTPGVVTVTFSNNAVNLDWADAANATEYTSTISGGTEGFRTFNTSFSTDAWQITNGGVSYSGTITSRNTDGRMLIDWPAVSGASSYRVLFTISGTTSNVLTTSTQYTITTTTGTAITGITVRAYANTAGTGVFREGSAVPFSTTQTPATKSSTARSWSGTSLSAPATPTGLSAVATSSSSVSLSWNAAARASTYEWYWTVSSTFTPNSSTTADVSGLTGTSDTHTGRSPATTYYYFVRARNSIGVSGWSARDSAITFAVAPATPTGLSVSAGGTATWIGSAGATSYTLQWQRATNSSGASPTATTTVSGLTGTSYSIPSVSGKIWARARVRASNAVGDSAYTAYTAWS